MPIWGGQSSRTNRGMNFAWLLRYHGTSKKAKHKTGRGPPHKETHPHGSGRLKPPEPNPKSPIPASSAGFSRFRCLAGHLSSIRWTAGPMAMFEASNTDGHESILLDWSARRPEGNRPTCPKWVSCETRKLLWHAEYDNAHEPVLQHAERYEIVLL